MRIASITIMSALCAGSALGCAHHSRSASAEGPVYTSTTTTTTTTSSSASGDTAMSGGMSGMSSGRSTSGMPDSAGHVERSNGAPGTGGMERSERREVQLAIRSLTRARNDLQHAGHEFGGHRAAALKAVDAALRELHAAAGQEAAMANASPASEERLERRERTEIREAVQSIERARRDMEGARHDFAGRRAETLAAVDAALRELRLAQEFEKR